MGNASSFSRGSLNPSDPARAARQRRERLIERALDTQRRHFARRLAASPAAPASR